VTTLLRPTLRGFLGDAKSLQARSKFLFLCTV